MLDDHVGKPLVLYRLLESPLGPFMEGVVAWLEKQKYPPHRIQRKLGQISFFNTWLRLRGVEVAHIDLESARRCVSCRRRRGRQESNELYTYGQLIAHIRTELQLPPLEECDPRSAGQELVEEFRGFLLRERRTSNVTAVIYCKMVEEFLRRVFGDCAAQPKVLTLGHVTDFLLSLNQSSSDQASRGATAIRAFSRYLLSRRLIERDIALGLPSVTRWHLRQLPERLVLSEVETLLRKQDRRDETGKRNYAVLAMLARLGLRTCEVARLTLDDVHWRDGTLRVLGKADTERQLPLAVEVGEALADYVRVRPRDVCRRLFLTVKAPRHPLGTNGIASLVRRAFVSTAVRARGGPHLLRHSLASELLHAGATLPEVGQVLGHLHPSTTEIYAKVRVDALRELAFPWPDVGGTL